MNDTRILTIALASVRAHDADRAHWHSAEQRSLERCELAAGRASLPYGLTVQRNRPPLRREKRDVAHRAAPRRRSSGRPPEAFGRSLAITTTAAALHEPLPDSHSPA